MTYFYRKNKVRKGKLPGPWKSFIFSERVQYGGASWEHVEELRWLEQEGKDVGRAGSRNGSIRGVVRNSMVGGVGCSTGTRNDIHGGAGKAIRAGGVNGGSVRGSARDSTGVMVRERSVRRSYI